MLLRLSSFRAGRVQIQGLGKRWSSTSGGTISSSRKEELKKTIQDKKRLEWDLCLRTSVKDMRVSVIRW
jgi:hypothetical protein